MSQRKETEADTGLLVPTKLIKFSTLPHEEKKSEVMGFKWKQLHSQMFGQIFDKTLYLFNTETGAMEIYKFPQEIIGIESLGNKLFLIKFQREVNIFEFDDNLKSSIKYQINLDRDVADDRFKNMMNGKLLRLNSKLKEVTLVDAEKNKIIKKSKPFEYIFGETHIANRIHILDDQHFVILKAVNTRAMIVDIKGNLESGKVREELYDIDYFVDCPESSVFVAHRDPQFYRGVRNLVICQYEDNQIKVIHDVDGHPCQVAPNGVVYYVDSQNKLRCYNPYLKQEFSLDMQYISDLYFFGNSIGVIKEIDKQFAIQQYQAPDALFQEKFRELLTETGNEIKLTPSLMYIIADYAFPFFSRSHTMINEIDKMLSELNKKIQDIEDNLPTYTHKDAMLNIMNQAITDKNALERLRQLINEKKEPSSKIIKEIEEKFPKISDNTRRLLGQYAGLESFTEPPPSKGDYKRK